MRKIGFIAGAVALAAAVAVTSQTAAFRSKPQTAAAGTAGATVGRADASPISPFELMKGAKDLPVQQWSDPF